MAGLPFSAVPTSSLSRFPLQLFRVLLLRRFWLPLPLASRTCRCGRPLDVRGHHRAACSRAGVLGSRGFSVESAAARVCREAGARVSLNVFVRDLDLPVAQEDGRRLEVIADGLPLFGGVQLARFWLTAFPPLATTYFGHFLFAHDLFWPRPILATPSLA